MFLVAGRGLLAILLGTIHAVGFLAGGGVHLARGC
jgi:hypothetical protein